MNEVPTVEIEGKFYCIESAHTFTTDEGRIARCMWLTPNDDDIFYVQMYLDDGETAVIYRDGSEGAITSGEEEE
tara:strand:- start:1595 stop:1816 length:222 start_codon:yes stop_codon:yes gene_type:complete